MKSRGTLALGLLLAGYLTLAIVAGAPNSPLTVLLPNGVAAPAWGSGSAHALGLDDVGRQGLTAIAWLVVLVVIGAFALVIFETWSKRISPLAVLIASGASLLISAAAPLLLSRDVYTYAGYGRILARYGENPYTEKLAAFHHDPFVAVTSVQWLHTHSNYGPVFTLLNAAVVATVSSLGGTILAFKIIAGVAVGLATVFVALSARLVRPDRTALAVALIGLNPVIVVHTVGGAHIDALIAAPLALAMLVAVKRGNPLAVTVLLTLVCLLKVVLLPVLVFWFWRQRRKRVVAHVAVVLALTAASLAPFLDGWHTFTPFATLGGIEAWASPSHLVGRGAEALFGSANALKAVEAAFIALFLVVFARGVRRSSNVVEAWGVTLLLLALSLPFLLPWYAAWFVPFLALLEDVVLTWAGLITSLVLALTLIPADPFHGVTTPAVMNGVHYGTAPVLLLMFAVVAWRAETSAFTARRNPSIPRRCRRTQARATRSAPARRDRLAR